jgi:hypothetical protein
VKLGGSLDKCVDTDLLSALPLFHGGLEYLEVFGIKGCHMSGVPGCR